jgi:hypothetical protein
MKKIAIAVMMLVFFSAVRSQVMQQKAIWATIKVPQLKCWQCKDYLEKYLIREKGPTGDAGIITWSMNLNLATLRVQYVPDRISLDYIRTALNNAGFDADTTLAENESYKMVPPACKRAADGGGPQKGKPCNLPPEQ